MRLEMAVEAYLGSERVREYSDLLCETGYEGNLCGVCTVEPGNKWGLMGPFKCRRCTVRSILYFVGSVMAICVLLTLTTFINFGNNRAGLQG